MLVADMLDKREKYTSRLEQLEREAEKMTFQNENKGRKEWYYNEYLKSPHWEEVKTKRKEIDGHKCRICRSEENLVVHHLTYDNLGEENIDEDVVTLCYDCHRMIHWVLGKTDFNKTKYIIDGLIREINNLRDDLAIYSKRLKNEITKGLVFNLWDRRETSDLFHIHVYGDRSATIINAMLDDMGLNIWINGADIEKAVNVLKDAAIWDMHKAGDSVKDIALKMGLNENIVYKRLKLYENYIPQKGLTPNA